MPRHCELAVRTASRDCEYAGCEVLLAVTRHRLGIRDLDSLRHLR